METAVLIQEIYRLQEAVKPMTERIKTLREELVKIQQEEGAKKLVVPVESPTGMDFAQSILIETEKVIVDPKKFFDKVFRKDFFGAVAVRLDPARELLGEKELRAISSITQEPVYVKVQQASKQAVKEFQADLRAEERPIAKLMSA